MNPPFNDPARQRASPDAARALAHAAPRAVLTPWIKTAARLLRARGTLTLIWRADGLADVLAALAPAFGAVAVTPVHPVAGQAGDPDPRDRRQRRAGRRSRCCRRSCSRMHRDGRRPRPRRCSATARRCRRLLTFRWCGRCRGRLVQLPERARRREQNVSSRVPAIGCGADSARGRNRGDQRQQDKDLHFHCTKSFPPGLSRQADVARSVPMVENW